MADLRMGVIGCGGRMGRMLVAEIVATGGITLAGGCTTPGGALVGRDVGELAGLARHGLAVGDDAGRLIGDSDVTIDFTRPTATARHATAAAAAGKPMVIGTTGLSADDRRRCRRRRGRCRSSGRPTPASASTCSSASSGRCAGRLGPDWDIEIVEMHHKGKVDAPSGTALALGRVAAAARGTTLEAAAQRGRDGITGARRAGDIGFAALRGGDAVGDHHVIFAGAGERLELVHRATNRAIYAKGAVRAAQWLVGRAPGLYGMKDVLEL